MTAKTDSNGEYLFTGLLPGYYTVSELEDPDYNRIKPAGENNYGPFEVMSGAVVRGQRLREPAKKAAVSRSRRGRQAMRPRR